MSHKFLFGMLGQNPPSFTPGADSNLKAWWDGADGSTITSSAGAVSQWNDKSINANNATQATGANKPALISNALNSKSVLEFTNKTMGFGNPSLLSKTSPFIMSFVMKFAAIGSTNYFFTVMDGSSPNLPPLLGYSGGKFTFEGGAASWQSYTGTNSPGTASYHIVQFVYNGSGSTTLGNLSLYVDNVSLTTGTTATNNGSNNAIGGYANNTSPAGVTFSGRIAEICISQSSTNRSNYYTYLKNKWGL